MHRKLLLLSAVVFALVNCGVGTRCFAEAADVSAQFEQADEYGDKGNYEQAEAIYKDVAEEYVGTESGLRAQRKLVCLYIKRGRTAEAETAYQGLLAGYTGYGDDNVIADAVDDVADAYRDVKKYDKALEIYSYVVDTWPGSKQAVGSHGGIARVNIALGRKEAAQEAIDKLFEGFSDNEDIANAVRNVANEYRNVKKYEKALQFYKQVVDSWPESEEAMDSQEDVAKLYIKLGDGPNAEAAVDKLIAKFAERDEIADAVDDVADKCRGAKKYDKALELYKYVVNTWPESEQAMGSQAEVAKLYIELGDDPNAKAAVDKLMADFAGRDEIADVVDYVADEYRDVKKYEKALELYKYVVNTWPESEQAIGSQGCVVRIYIELGDDPNAEAAVNKLIAKFADSDDITDAVRDAANEYRDVKKYEKALQFYKQVVDSWPESEQAVWSQAAIAKLYIELGDDPNAKAAVDKLIADFSANSDLPAALNLVGEIYEKAGKCEEAKSVYQQVIQQNPDRRLAQKVKQAILKVDVLPLTHSGDDANSVVEAIDNLIADFNDHPTLAEAIYQIGKKYHDDACRDEGKGLDDEAIAHYWKAITTWQIVREKYPDSDLAMRVCYLTGDCYRKVDEREKAVECYEEILAKWPDYEYAWSAQFLIGYCYEQLKHAGAVERTVADARTKAAYERVVAEYPDCPAVEAACDWLSHPGECKCE